MLQRAILTGLFAAASILAPAAAFAQGKGGKPPASGTSTPEIVYTLTGKTYQLRVANEDGTGAVTLHSSSQPIYARFGPRGSGKIAFWEGKTLKMLTYEASSSGVRTINLEPLMSTTGSLFSVITDFDYSPAGSHLAWWHEDDRTVYVYDIGARTITAEYDTGPHVSDVAITQDGTRVLYPNSIGGSVTNYTLMSAPVTGGIPTEVGITGNVLGVEPGHQDDKLLLMIQVVGVGRYLELVPAGQTSGTRLVDGHDPSLHCSDSRFLYFLPGSRPATLIYDRSTELSSTFTRDSKVRWSSYMPTC